MEYYCYLLSNSEGCTYIGMTNNLEKRLKKHNGLVDGGAKATRRSNNWKYEHIVGRFDRSSALTFEWYWKHYRSNTGRWYKTKSGVVNKIMRLNLLLSEDRWSHLIHIDQ